jgi:uncharacterized membrane protein YedE/YeeE
LNYSHIRIYTSSFVQGDPEDAMGESEIVRTGFAPFAALAGGGMIGAAAVLLMFTHGRIAGISGIAARLLPPYGSGDMAGRIAFVVGLVAAPLFAAASGAAPALHVSAGPLLLAAAGVLVGFGTVWGNGCTSGHGVCGLSRLSLRSLVATSVFMATAIATVFVVRHLL